ncbi:hypothetical protein [Microbispora bryophytorum]|uniref:hypothetical protein n=1 Tax=Microbispora bryophytorum TaxID=1460882 RepID=UPI001CC2AF07|nr:hypothetical protein [Microbispora camponoti]
MPGPGEAVHDTLQLYFLCALPSLPPASAVALILLRYASRASRNGPGCRPVPLAELLRERAWRV